MAPAILSDVEVPPPSVLKKELNGAKANGANTSTEIVKANANGAVKKVSNGNGTVPISEVAALTPWHGEPESLTALDFIPETLTDAAAVEWLASEFHRSNVINRHRLHVRELKHVEAEHVRSAEYMSDVLRLDRRPHPKDEAYIKLRFDLGQHLEAAQANTDGLLEAIASLSEKLSVAQRGEALAQADSKAAHARHEELESEPKSVRRDLTEARTQLLKLVDERDRAVRESDRAEGLLNIRDGQVQRLNVEVKRLEERTSSLTVKLAYALEAQRAAQLEEIKARKEYQREHDAYLALQAEMTKLQASHENHADIVNGLKEDIKKLERLLINANTEVERVEESKAELAAKYRDVEATVRGALTGQKDAEAAAAVMKEQRDEARKAADYAIEQRKSAEFAWADAERARSKMAHSYKEIQAAVTKLEADLKQETREKDVLEEKLAKAVERADMACHFTQEAIEWGQALNLTNHQLFEQYEISFNEKVKAVEERYAEERDKNHWEGEAHWAQHRVEELREARRRLHEEKNRAQTQYDTLVGQYQKAAAEYRSDLLDYKSQLGRLQREQMSWDRTKANFEKTIDENRYELDRAGRAKDEAEGLLAKEKSEKTRTIQEYELKLKKKDEAHDQLRKMLEEFLDSDKDRKESLVVEKKAKDLLQDQYSRLEEECSRLQEAVNAKIEARTRGHSFASIAIHDIFIGSRRLNDESQKEVYEKIGGHYGASEAFPLEQCFPEKADKKKKKVVLVYTVHGEESPRILTAGVDNSFKFPAIMATAPATPA
ncbi:hypothetical protein BO78DRAFT_395709 [Aspergillus sclerotiicarbonarius CBS 121057]|uniref:Uncharacterized protein n=1 Tax=Aspergillus sclerotiicarbonarius (strain CBS 121057 / IBT 28362) TaxID=1448318 RepID=A0A319FK14_ASPSB|nr:hypothetical protein BO78DRAFT_395709 [Aspergillus sclerotiicarbonarius CBS 121057]